MNTDDAAAHLPDRPLLRPDEVWGFLKGDAPGDAVVGRRQLYDALNAFLETGGAEGIPCIRIGRSIRIPRAAFLAWLDTPVGAQREPVA